MAERIVQPMVKNEEGDYDELIFNSAVSANIAEYASEDLSKGSIEDRLTQLETPETENATINVTYLSDDSNVTLYKKSNYVIADCHLVFKTYDLMWEFFGSATTSATLFTVPESFIPSVNQSCALGAIMDGMLQFAGESAHGTRLSLFKPMIIDTLGQFRVNKYMIGSSDYYGTDFYDGTFSYYVSGVCDFQIGYFV